MRPLPILSFVLLTLAPHAFAQVTLDLHALQALPERGGPGPPVRVIPPLPQHQAGRTQTVTPRSESPAPGSASAEAASTKNPPPEAAPTASAAASGSAAPSPSAPVAPPALPQTVPQTALITPIAPALPGAESTPPPPPVSEKSATNAAPTVSGLRVTFASGQSELSPESVAAIKQFASGPTTGETSSFNVLAYAPGSPDDPSTARRVSLSRAMAVRSALVADGVPSARIYVRALGAQSGDGPPDRVDVNVEGSTASGAASAQATPR
jgi:outer membrane protein OmpA-like peptidoglycan-associated protein